mgnify:FL=1
MEAEVVLAGTQGRVGHPITGELVLRATEAVAMPIVTLELPAGVEIDKAALEAAGFSKVEVVRRRVALYAERFEAGSEKRVPLTLTPRRGGTLHGGPVTARPYYEPERSAYVAFPTLEIAE